jgi:hypothetical protein
MRIAWAQLGHFTVRASPGVSGSVTVKRWPQPGHFIVFSAPGLSPARARARAAPSAPSRVRTEAPMTTGSKPPVRRNSFCQPATVCAS